MPKKLPDIKPKVLESSEKPKTPVMRRLTVWMGLTVAVLAVFQALITNSQATNGASLARLSEEQDQLTSQVDALERQVAGVSSLSHVRDEATSKLQMQPVDKNVMYMTYATPTPSPEAGR